MQHTMLQIVSSQNSASIKWKLKWKRKCIKTKILTNQNYIEDFFWKWFPYIPIYAECIMILVCVDDLPIQIMLHLHVSPSLSLSLSRSLSLFDLSMLIHLDIGRIDRKRNWNERTGSWFLEYGIWFCHVKLVNYVWDWNIAVGTSNTTQILLAVLSNQPRLKCDCMPYMCEQLNTLFISSRPKNICFQWQSSINRRSVYNYCKQNIAIIGFTHNHCKWCIEIELAQEYTFCAD